MSGGSAQGERGRGASAAAIAGAAAAIAPTKTARFIPYRCAPITPPTDPFLGSIADAAKTRTIALAAAFGTPALPVGLAPMGFSIGGRIDGGTVPRERPRPWCGHGGRRLHSMRGYISVASSYISVASRLLAGPPRDAR